MEVLREVFGCGEVPHVERNVSILVLMEVLREGAETGGEKDMKGGFQSLF